MPKDSAATSPTAPASDRLKEVRDRIAELHDRIKAGPDAKGLAALVAAAGDVVKLLDRLIGAAPSPTTKADASFAWPRDLTATETAQPAWGHDPAEVGRG